MIYLSSGPSASRLPVKDVRFQNTRLAPRPFVHWPKSPAAISADITSSAAGKKRGFCRLRLNSSLLYLREIELHRRRAPEDLHRHLQAVFLVVHRFHHAV